jgi:hypothetical protein
MVRGSSASAPVFIDLGDALSSGAERMLNLLFQKVVIIQDMHLKDVSRSDIDAIVTPEVVKADFVAIGWPAITHDQCLIILKWSIIDKDGKMIYVNTFSGEGRRKRTKFTSWTVDEQINECMILALKDHFHKALGDISSAKWY